MANIKIDDNYKGVSAGITDEATPVVQSLRVNSATYRLLTEPSIDSEASGSIAVNVVAGNITVSSGTPVSLDWVGGVKQSGGSISVNVLAGNLTTSSGTPVSLDWIAGTKLSGGSVAVNLGNSGTVALRYDATGSIAVNVVAGNISVSTGTPVSLDWVAGTRMSGGSVAVNVLGGVISSGTTMWLADGTVRVTSGSVQLISPYLAGGSIQLLESRHIIGSVINNGGTVSFASGSVQLISPYLLNLASGSVQLIRDSYVNVATGSIQLIQTPPLSISGGSVGINYASGGSISVNVRQIANGSVQLIQTPPLTISTGSIQLIQTPPLIVSAGSVQVGTVTKLTSGSVQLMDSRQVIGSVIGSGGTFSIAGGTVRLGYDATGSIAVNIVAGNITTSSGTPVSLDWVGGTLQSGGSLSVNVIAGTLSSSFSAGSVKIMSSSGTLAEVDNNNNLKVTLGTKLDSVNDSILVPDGTIKIINSDYAGGSIAVNMVAGNVSVSTGTPVSIDWIGGVLQSGGSIGVNLRSGASVQLISPIINNLASGSVQLIRDSFVNVATGSIQLIQTPPLTVSSGSIQLISPYINISSGSVGINYSSGGSISVNVRQFAGGSVQLISPFLAGGSIQLVESRQIIGHVVNNGGTTFISAGSIFVSGAVAADAALVGNPILNGGRASAVVPTAVSADGDVVNLWLSRNGAVMTTNTGGTVQLAGGTVNVSGAVAHDSAYVGNPVVVGAVAETALSGITAVADGDVTKLYCGADGVQFVRPHTGLEDIVTGSSGTASGAGTILLLAAGGAGVKVYITDVTVSNSYGTMVIVSLCDGPNANKYYIPAPGNGGATHAFTVPLPGSANAVWSWRSSGTASSGSIIVSAIAFKSKI
jgi:hypothetical protein